MKTQFAGWENIAAHLKVVSLTLPVQLLVPSLIVTTLSRSTRGVSFYPGRSGFALGAVLFSGSVAVGWLLGGPFGLAGTALAIWLLGTSGVAMMVNSVRPLAFIKPICTRCRLLPVIKEHEAIHLSGVSGERAVWASMRARHSKESLSLEGDPAICWFCPIPKRLSEH